MDASWSGVNASLSTRFELVSPSLGKIDLIDLDACLVKAIIGVAGDDRRIFAAVVSRRQLLEPRLAKIYALRGY